MGTMIVLGLLLAVVSGIVIVLRRDRKQGKSTCGGNCAHCRGCRH